MEQPECAVGEDDGLLTSQDVADRYRVHVRTLPGLVREKKIPPPADGWTGAHKRWIKSEVVSHIKGMRKKELQEQAS